MGLKKKLLKVFGRKKKKNTATAKTVKTANKAGPVLYIPTSRTPASMYSSSASLFRPVSSYSGSSSGFSGYGRLSPPGFSGSGYGRLSGSGFSGGSSVVSSGLSGLSGRNSSGNTYVHLPGKYQYVLNGTPAREDPGAMIARVGDIIAYTDKYDGNTYEWLGKVKSLEKDGVVVEQRGYFEKTENVAGRTVKLPQEVRNVRVSRFKRVSPKDVKQYERQGWKFSHAYGNNGGNGSGNGSSANRSLLRGLTTGQFITFVYRGKPVYGQIEKIDRRTGEVHMKKNPQGMYNQNLLGIQIPTPGSEAEIKFRPSANSQITRLRSGSNPTSKKALTEKGFQNLSVGFKLSNNNGNKGMNFIVEKLLGDHAEQFKAWDSELRGIQRIQSLDDKRNQIQAFVLENLGELEKMDALLGLESTKYSAAAKTAIKDMKEQLLKRVKKMYPIEEGKLSYDEMVTKAKDLVASQTQTVGWGSWLLGKIGQVGRAAGGYMAGR